MRAIGCNDVATETDGAEVGNKKGRESELV